MENIEKKNALLQALVETREWEKENVQVKGQIFSKYIVQLAILRELLKLNKGR